MKKCEITTCDRTFQHKHHIISKCFKGTNKDYNIAYLCASHHVDVHKGIVILEGKFLTSTGIQLIYHYNSETSITGMEQQDKVYLK